MGVGCISAAVCLFSIVDVLAKWLAADYPVNQIIFFRMLFGLVPAIVLLGPNGFKSAALYTARPLTHLWRAATGIGAMGLFFFALPLMPLADAVAISFAKPFFLAFLAVPLLGETFDRYRIAATALGFIGVLVIVQPAGGYSGWEGPALALGSAIGFALSMITIRKLSTTESTPQIVVYYTALATLVSGLSLFSAWTTPSLSALGLFVLLGLVGGTGQLLMTAAFRRAPASVIGPFNYSAILWAAIFGFLIWGEQLRSATAIGAVIIIGSGLWLLRREANQAVSTLPRSLRSASERRT